MRNILFEAYNSLDAALMKGVNAGVRAHNWITGGTKRELAHTFVAVAPIFETIRGMHILPVDILLTLPFFLFISHYYQGMYKEIEEREDAARKNELKDGYAEEWKNSIGRMGGYLWTGIGCAYEGLAIVYPREGYFTSDRREASICRLIGDTLYGASFFVMCADELPPRKNCVRRGLEKVTEWYEAPKAQPAPVPVPVALQVSLMTGGA